MSSPALETFLARLLVEDETRRRFLADAVGEARRAGLGEDDAASLAAIDRAGLVMAAASYAAKRTARPKAGRWLHRLRRRWRR
jgi:hypothetical protein